MIDANIFNGDILNTSYDNLNLRSRDLVDRNIDCSTCPNDEESYTLEDSMEDFDPSLFCPDIIMELGDTPIEISNDTLGNSSEKCNGSIYHEDDCNENDANANPVQYTKIHCTSCNDHLGSAVNNHDNVRVHPLLEVLVCKDCYEFYQSGEFGKDEDGSEMYCRWCGEGGQVICCSNCEYVFCTKCIRRNLGRKELAGIKSKDDWTCLKCDLSQLTNMRAHCADFMEYIGRERSRASTLEKDLLNKDYSDCCTVRIIEKEVRKRKRISSDDEADLDYDPFEDEQYHRYSTSSSKRTRAPATISLATIAPMVVPVNSAQQTSNNTVTGATNITPTTLISKPSLLPVPNQNRSSAPTSQLRLLTNTQQILALAQRALPTLLPKDKTRITPLPTMNTKETRIPPSNVKSSGIYKKLVRLAGRISSGLSSSLHKLAGGKVYALSLEEAVNIHNQVQEALNTTIDSLVNLKKSLTEVRPGQTYVNVPTKRIRPHLQNYAISNTKGSKSDLAPNVSLFKSLNKKILLHKNTDGVKCDTMNPKQEETNSPSSRKIVQDCTL